MEHKDKMQYLIFSILIFTTMLILFVIGAFFTPSFKDFLTGNVVPELIGICIELLIIILIFEKWQSNKKHQKDIVHEKRLREYLIFFLKYGLSDLPNELKVGKFFGENYIENEKEIKNIVNYMSSNKIDADILKSMKEHLLIDKSALENLLEVASTLTDAHFKSWIRIVYFINKLSHTNNNNLKELKSIVIDILQNIKRFDKASYDNHIYVGAKRP